MTDRHRKEIRRERNLLAELSGLTELKRISGTHGGEWAGPCPWCGGEDRLHVQPHHADGGRWFCRKCRPGVWGDWHDLIERMGKVDRIQKANAIARKEMADANEQWRRWQQATLARVHRWEDTLFSERGDNVRSYLVNQRLLKEETLSAWMIGFKPYGTPSGITIPCVVSDCLYYVNVRQPAGNTPKYKKLKNSRGFLFGADTFKDCHDAFVFESELDAVLAAQTCQEHGLKVGCGSLPASHSMKRPPYIKFINHVERFILVPDNDPSGEAHASKWKRELGNRLKVVHVPDKHKDFGEFAAAGGDLFEFLYKSME